jgi:tetratricopeptide (TPR) repeat protein
MNGAEYMRTPAFLALFLLVSSLPIAADAGGREDYYRALDLEKAGKYDEAVVLLEGVTSAGREFADDALMEAGRIAEEVFLDGPRAINYYERLLKMHPSSRLVRRANARAEMLLAADPKHIKTILEFKRAILDFPNDKAAAIAKVLGLIEANPSWPGSDHALYWLGEVSRNMDDRAAAEKYLGGVISKYPSGEWAFKAMRSLGDMAYERKDYTASLEYFSQAMASPDPSLRGAVQADAERARTHLQRTRLSFAAFALLFLWWLYLARGILKARPGWKGVLKPHPETWLMAALSAVLLLLFAVFQGKYLAGAAVIIAVFLVSTQLSGSLLKVRRPAGIGRVLYLAATMVVMSAALYGIMVRMGLIGAMIHTLRFGPG